MGTFMVTDDIAAGHLVQPLPEFEFLEQRIHAIFPHCTYIPDKVTVFIDYLVGTFGHGPRAKQTGRIHISDFRNPENSRSQSATGPYTGST